MKLKRIVKANQSTDLTSISVITKLARDAADFPEQTAFVDDPVRYIAAQCSRRAGKTNAVARKFLKAMEKYPKSQSIYLALTEESAYDIMWPVLVDINDKYKLNCTLVESKRTMFHPNGSSLKLYGADMKNFIKRLKGRKAPAIAVDEAQDFGTHLEELINTVLNPMIADYPESWLALTGTPGPVPNGYFFEVTHRKRFGYNVHKWTLLENPYMPDPEAFINELIKKNEWEPDHPTLLREWRNQWVLDPHSLWIRYQKEKNDFDELPQHVKKWHYILGVDIGFRDADAIAVLAWSEEIKQTFLVEEIITNKQDITALVQQIEATSKRYNPDKIMIDQGGLGLKIAEEIRRRHGVPVEAAEKRQKSENVAVLNDELRLGNFKAKADSTFAQESYLIQIDWLKSTPDKIVLKKDVHSDIIDAVLYAHRESYAYTHTPEKIAPKPGTKEWAEAQENSMFEAKMEEMQQEAMLNKYLNGEFE